MNTTETRRTKQQSIEKTEEILRKITDNFHCKWEQKVKGTRFTLMGYFVNGKMLIIQLFDDGSIYHFGQTGSIRWDETEKQLIELYKV
jgi:hypothetical protein